MDLRIGNDFDVVWSIYRDGEPFDLSEVSLTLYLKNIYGKKTITDFSVEDNKVKWTFFGKDQKQTGKYTLILVGNEDEEGMFTTDAEDFVRLVSRSSQVDNEPSENADIQIEVVEISSNIRYGGVDTELSETSNNPIANKAVAKAFATQAESINNKVDKVEGLGLSEENYTADEKAKLAGLDGELANKADKSEIPTKLSQLEQDIEIGGTPDWDASEGEAGFIKNRTHYAKYNNEYTQWLSPEEDNVSFISKQPIEQIFHINDVVYVSCPNFGQVKVDKDDVTLFAIDWEGTLTTDIFGILKVHKDAESKTFTIFSNYEDGLEVSTSIYKTLDEKFIPDTIARQEDIPTKLSQLERDIEVGSDVINFTNPVGPHCPDPCFWKADDGYFYVKGTGRIATVLRTRDFVNYENTGRTFLSESALEWINDNYAHYYSDTNAIIVPHCWAPFVIKIGSNWVLYMAVVERSEIESGIVEDGAAHIVAFTSRTPYGDFTNPVTIVSDGDFKLTNSVVWNNVIDPFVYCNPEDQKLYLVAGSSYSIGRLELTDDGLATVLEKGVNNKCVRIGGLTITSDPSREQVYEGAYIYPKIIGDKTYYYLFASKGHYAEDNYGLVAFVCNDLNAKPGDTDLGWRDELGISPITKVSDDRANNRVILSGYSKDSGKPWGPGHCAGIFETADGKTWMLYHCHTGKGTNDRQLFVQEVLWDDNSWPYFEGGKPIESSKILNNIITETPKIGLKDGYNNTEIRNELTELSAEVGKKQDTISDLETIRSGASKGATALQSVPEGYATKEYVANLLGTIINGDY